MPLVWHANKWLDWSVSEDEKIEIGPLFSEELQSVRW